MARSVATMLMIVAAIAIVVGLIWFGIWRDMTRWHDCRAAGRSWLVCILMLGR